jgi:nucleoside-diphosphate-sugar epimerase
MHESLETKTVLVTGAAGFLGSHLCDALLARGHRVVGVDDLSHGNSGNLSQAVKNRGFMFHLVDITWLLSRSRAMETGSRPWW